MRCNKPAVATVIGSMQSAHLDGNAKSRGARKGPHVPLLACEMDGVLYESLVYRNGLAKPLPKGEKVEIYYREDDPTYFRLVDEQKERVFTLLAGVLVLVGLALLALGWVVLV